jgi:hypothetical protein
MSLENLPTITSWEAYVVTTAVVLLFFAPGVVSWIEERSRRRRLRVVATEVLRVSETSAQIAGNDSLAMGAEATPWASVQGEAVAPEAAGAYVAAAPDAETDLVPPQAVGAVDPERSGVLGGGDVIEIQPLSGDRRYRFRLDDLHPAQLPDWPPAAIRDDPRRLQAWHEAEAAAQPYRSVIYTASIWSPYPVRSQCLSAASTDPVQIQLRYLLFPVPWPVSQNQAVAQAVFLIDRGSGTVRGWLDALRAQELSEENRREILEAGGEI